MHTLVVSTIVIAHLNRPILNLHQALSSYQGIISLHGVRSEKVIVASKSEVRKHKAKMAEQIMSEVIMKAVA